MMNSIHITIGGLTFRLSLNREILIDNGFLPFLNESKTPDIIVEYISNSSVEDYELRNDNDWSRIIIYYHPNIAHHFDGLRGCMMYIPMHQVLLAYNKCFLHASIVTSKHGAILFSGKSGAGKSTQAELWKTHMGSTIINGDRAIISKENRQWRVYGSPYAGSSKYYVQQDEKICALVFLEQGKTNSISKLSFANAFKKIFMQISIDHRDKDQTEKTCDLISDFIEHIPIYQLTATPDRHAVDLLNKELEGIKQ